MELEREQIIRLNKNKHCTTRNIKNWAESGKYERISNK